MRTVRHHQSHRQLGVSLPRVRSLRLLRIAVQRMLPPHGRLRQQLRTTIAMNALRNLWFRLFQLKSVKRTR